MLSANVFDMFSGIEAIEKKQRTYGSLIAPRIAFRDVRVVS
jgi:predicted Zn-dependent protease